MSREYSVVKDKTYFYILLRVMQDDLTYMSKNKYLPKKAVGKFNERVTELREHVYDVHHQSYSFVNPDVYENNKIAEKQMHTDCLCDPGVDSRE